MSVSMTFVETHADVSVVEKGVRNSWQWSWLEERCDHGIKFSEWCKKLTKPGSCYCTVCNVAVVYGSSGKKALRKHANKMEHHDTYKAIKTCSRLDSPSLNTPVSTWKSLEDASNEVKAVIGLFVSEHCLPFTLAPQLLKLSQRLSGIKNKGALSATRMTHTSATYYTTHGVASEIKQELQENMAGHFVSLNVDEATNAAGNKVINVLAQYFDDKENKIVLDLIGSRQENISTADNIVKNLDALLLDRGVKWEQVISVLMDNCSVMRGAKGGVETKIKERNANLLDIHGDTVHIVNNSAKKLFSIVEKKFYPFQSLCSDIYFDIEDSPKQRSLFFDIQCLLGLKKKSLMRVIPTRFLQMKLVAERLKELFSCVILYYSAFLEAQELKSADQARSKIFEEHNVGTEKKKEIKAILEKLRKHQSTDAGKARKERIINLVYDNREKCLLLMEVYIGILEKFEGFVKKFQSEKPMCHILHFELFKVTKSLFSCFISPEHIPPYDAAKLEKLDITNPSLHLKDRHMCVGNAAYLTMQKYLKNKSKYPWMSSFFTALKEGYIEAAKMIKKLPLTNKTITALAYLDPANQRSESTTEALLSLAKLLPNVISPDDLGRLDSELRDYVTDDDISVIDADSDDSDFRLDTSWWTHIFKMKQLDSSPKYPLLSRLAKALLTIFSGPLIEGTFNIMHDIVEEDRSRLTPFNYEALAMVKSYLKARNKTSIDMDISKSMLKHVRNSYAAYTKHLDSQQTASSSQQTASSSQQTAIASQQIATSSQQITTSSTAVVPSVCQQTTNTISCELTPSPSASSASLQQSCSPAATSFSENASDLALKTTASSGKRKQASLLGLWAKKPKI